MRKRVLVPVADGSEEIEFVGIVDTLRRAGAEVVVAAVGEVEIVASRGVKIVADVTIKECCDEDYALIVLPGGMPGTESLRDCDELTLMLRKQRDGGKLYAAICAAPVLVLQHHGLLEGLQATSHPVLWDKLQARSEGRVVVDKSCVTSQGPGTVLEFAVKLVELLFGKEKADQIANAMVI